MARPKTAPELTTMRCSLRQYERIASLKQGMPQWAFMNRLFESYQSSDRPAVVRDLVVVDSEEKNVKVPKAVFDKAKELFPGWRHHQIVAVLLLPYDEYERAA